MHTAARQWLLAALVLACALAMPSWARAENRSADFRIGFGDSLTALPEVSSLNAHGAVYVPIYNQVRDSNPSPVDVTATLRIDNASDSKPIVIDRIDYFSTSGKLLRRYLDAPIAIRPFGSIQVSISGADEQGGVSTNFVVAWSGNGPIAEPVIEAVMVGTQAGSTYSFVSQGRPIKLVGKSRWLGLPLN